jgi:PPOX class probable F420-dependent enzyme
MSPLDSLTPAEAALLDESRRAVLATIRPDGRPRLVPVTYAADRSAGVLYSPLDEKPKSVADPRRLARVRDIAVRPGVTLLVDRWSEDWRHLAWLRLDARAALLEPSGEAAQEHLAAAAALARRYAQYATQQLTARPMLRLEVVAVRSWSAG